MTLTDHSHRRKWVYYAALLFVVVFWGISSVGYYYFYQYYSAAALTSIMTFFSAAFFWILAVKKRLHPDRRYYKVVLPICLLNALANVLQRIGLQYTTPANYAFFDHLSCVVVPIMLFFFIKKKPTVLQAFAAVFCLIGCFILSGVSFFSGHNSLGIGDVLCIISGILLGVCVAAVGCFTKELNAILFMVFYMTTYFTMSLLMTISMNFIRIGGVAMEPIVITLNGSLLLIVILFGLLDIALCWLLRTEAIRHIDPVTVATVSPFAAVITGALSVIVGIDQLTPNLVIGGSIILATASIPEIIEAVASRKKGFDS